MIGIFFQFIENYANSITAISAVIGVLVALITIFIPYIYKNINKPNLCVSTSGFNKALFTPILLTTLNKNGFSLKLDISNTGRSEATKVQLCLNNIFYKDKELPVAPLKLNWSYQDTEIRLCLPPKTHTSILQGSHAHCDFLFLFENDKKEYEAFLASQVEQFNKLENDGHYKIKLAVGASEIETTFWEISFDFSKKASGKNEIISNINCKKKRFYMNNPQRNLIDIIIILLETLIFFFVFLFIKDFDNLRFFIVSFACFSVLFSIRKLVLGICEKNNKDNK